MEVYFRSKLGKRRTNEDRYTIILNENGQYDFDKQHINIYGIYDGHGGDTVSTFLSNIMPTIFLDKRVQYPLRKSYVNRVCEKVQNILIENYKKSKECGSTCLIIIKFKKDEQDFLNIINIGDSRAIICSNNRAYQLSIDHKPLCPYEKARITKQGGHIEFDGIEWRINSLSLSRAFGDYESLFTQPKPDLFLRKLTKSDKFIILGCDGLYDVVSNQTVVDLVLNFCYDTTGKRAIKNDNITKDNIAKKLCDFATSQNSTDNITAIVVFF